MKLISGPASPFGRKARVMVMETELESKVEVLLIPPGQIAVQSMPHNPLGKVPVLIRDDGTPLYDSPVICEYLDSLHASAKFFPPGGEARWITLRLQALGDGIAETVGAIGAEMSRPEPSRNTPAIAAHTARFARALDYVDNHLEEISGPPDVGALAIACGLGYADFRDIRPDWRRQRPHLAKWFEKFSQRDSMQRTLYRRPDATR